MKSRGFFLALRYGLLTICKGKLRNAIGRLWFVVMRNKEALFIDEVGPFLGARVSSYGEDMLLAYLHN